MNSLLQTSDVNGNGALASGQRVGRASLGIDFGATSQTEGLTNTMTGMQASPELTADLAMAPQGAALGGAIRVAANAPEIFYLRGLSQDAAVESQPKIGLERGPSYYRGRITGPVRLIIGVKEGWQLKNKELATLLDYENPVMIEYLIDGKLTFTGKDRQDRARILYAIFDLLSDIFVEISDHRRWIRSTLPRLGGSTPLNFMISKRIPGMIEVLDLVRHRMANR